MLSHLTKGTALIDGEICALDPDGRSNFSKLKSSLDGKTPIVFFAFDLLTLDGKDIAALPQLARKAHLQGLLAGQPANSAILYSDHVIGRGEEVFDAMCASGNEAVIA